MSWGQTEPPPIFEGEDELQLKLEWARLTRGREALFREAGYKVFPGEANYGRAMQAYNWRHDPIVLAHWQMLAEAPQADNDDEEMQRIKRIAFEVMESPTASNGDKIKAAALLAEIKGAIKQGVNINTNIDNSTNNTLVVPADPMTEEEEEIAQIRMEARQARLMKHARARELN